MSGRIGVAQLRQQLAAVLDAAGNGSVYLVTRSGRDVAVIGPAKGGVSQLSKEAEDCARALVDAEASRDAANAEAIRLRLQVSALQEELTNARELNTGKKRWGK